MPRRFNSVSARRVPQSATLRALSLSLGLPRPTVVDRCLRPRVALDVLHGTRGVKALFFHLAEAATLSGAFCAMGLEDDSLDVVRCGQQTIGLAFVKARETEIWAISHEDFSNIHLLLEVFERQIEVAGQSQILAAEAWVKERQQDERKRADKGLRRAA